LFVNLVLDVGFDFTSQVFIVLLLLPPFHGSLRGWS
jgi:hypothetical protein